MNTLLPSDTKFHSGDTYLTFEFDLTPKPSNRTPELVALAQVQSFEDHMAQLGHTHMTQCHTFRGMKASYTVVRKELQQRVAVRRRLRAVFQELAQRDFSDADQSN